MRALPLTWKSDVNQCSIGNFKADSEASLVVEIELEFAERIRDRLADNGLRILQ